MKRSLFVVIGVIAGLVLLPGVASAKVPPFTVEASPSDPVAGDVVRLTVRFWDDRQHTDPARWPDMPVFDEFLWAHPVGDATEPIPVAIRFVGPGVYRGEVTLASPGGWVLCTWEPRCASGRRSMAGYPSRTELEVASSAPDPVVDAVAAPPMEPSPARVPVPLLALSALVVSAAALVRRSVRTRRT